MPLNAGDLYPDRTKAEVEADKIISLVPGVRTAVGAFLLLLAATLIALWFAR